MCSTTSLPQREFGSHFSPALLTNLTRRQYLVKNKYASPGKVAINGGSNGGILYPIGLGDLVLSMARSARGRLRQPRT